MSGIDSVYLIAAASNVDALIAAQASLAGAGYSPVSSADFSAAPEVVSALLSADAVVRLDGWESSPGARVEVGIFAATGRPVLTLSDLLPLAA